MAFGGSRGSQMRNLARATAAQAAGNGTGRPGGAQKSIAHMLATQESQLLRKGTLASERYDQIRQRHMWSTYYFQPLAGGAIDATANPYFVKPNENYDVFVAGININGQGLPSGLQLDTTDTNMPNASQGRISDDQNFSIWEIGASIIPVRQDIIAQDPTIMADGELLVEDLAQIAENSVLTLTYLTNTVPLGQLGEFIQPGGPDITGRSLLNYAQASFNDVGPPDLNTGGLGEGNATASPWDGRVARIAQNSGNMPASPGFRRKLDVPIFLRNTQTFKMSILIARPFTIRSVREGGLGAFAVRVDWWAVESFREQG